MRTGSVVRRLGVLAGVSAVACLLLQTPFAVTAAEETSHPIETVEYYTVAMGVYADGTPDKEAIILPDGTQVSLPAHTSSSVDAAVPAADPDKPTAYTFILPDSATPNGPVHWDTCRPLRYAINLGSLPDARARGEIDEAFRRLSQAYGVSFQYAGNTPVVPLLKDWEKPFVGAARTGQNPVDIYVAFATESQIPDLAGNVVGWGGPVIVAPNDPTREQRIALAGLVIDRNHNFKMKAWEPGGRGVIMLHELGHAFGLGHAPLDSQVMYAMLGPNGGTLNTQFGNGDRTGLGVLKSMPNWDCVPPVQ